ncbi:MAG: META domain-containing protein [Acidobacteria bacterium]|jgi:heat shock protein HslJ|nr:META domain-containing protein [Acidobacteriota bacterium]
MNIKKSIQVFSLVLLAGLMFIGINAQTLEGEWKLVKAKKNGDKVVFNKEIKTTLIFGEGNRMSGNAGCNRYSTTYKLEDKKKIDFQPIISTKMACTDDDLMKQENTFFSVIDKTDKYKIKGNYLIFFDETKQNLLKFARVYKQN